MPLVVKPYFFLLFSYISVVLFLLTPLPKVSGLVSLAGAGRNKHVKLAIA